MNKYIPDWTEDEVTNAYLNSRYSDVSRCWVCGCVVDEMKTICDECVINIENEV
jgi:hypothetical protein